MAKIATVSELKAQAAIIATQIAEREAAEKRIADVAEWLKKGKHAQVEVLAALNAVFPKPTPQQTISRSMGKRKPVRNAGRGAGAGALPMKYFHPTDKTLAWSGKARMPAWLAALCVKGKTKDDFMKKPR